MAGMKLSILSTVLIAAASLTMGSARAQAQATGQFKMQFKGGGFLLAGCLLSVTQTDDGFVYRPRSESVTGFVGYWPTRPGVIQLTAGAPAATELLNVDFQYVNQKLMPVSYVYQNLWLATQNSLLGPNNCEGLTLEN